MGIKKWNEIFGYGFFIVGLVKLIMIILIFLQILTNLSIIFNGGEADIASYDSYSSLTIVVGFAEIILGIGSIIMIILNTTRQPEVITGYLLGIGAILLELIIPRFLALYYVFVECGMFMKAGTKIKNKNGGISLSNNNIKQKIKNTEWFYSKDDK